MLVLELVVVTLLAVLVVLKLVVTLEWRGRGTGGAGAGADVLEYRGISDTYRASFAWEVYPDLTPPPSTQAPRSFQTRCGTNGQSTRY